MRWKSLFMGIIIVCTAGCAPVISREALKSVSQEIGFNAILKDPDSFRGKIVLLGGEIIEAKPVPNQTLMVILQRPLGFRDKPSKEGVSLGRFILSTPGFMDPAIYRPGRLLTVVGSVVGKETRPLGEIQYAYPLIAQREFYLWPVEEEHHRPRFYFGIGIGKSL